MVDQRMRGSNEPVWDSFGDAVQELVEQAHRGQYEVLQDSTREQANAYMEFLESLFLHYRESRRTTESHAQEEEEEEEEGRLDSFYSPS